MLSHISFESSHCMCNNQHTDWLCIIMQVKGTNYDTKDGTCIRDYIHVTDLVEAHVKSLEKLELSIVSIYNVGTGQGSRLLWIRKEPLSICFD